MNLSHLAQEWRYGFMPKPKFAIVEACDLTEDGEIVPTSGVGILPTICRLADYIIVELNAAHPKTLRGMHDIYEPLDPPCREAIPVYTVKDRCGLPYVKVDPKKIIAVVKSDLPNEVGGFPTVYGVTATIVRHVDACLPHGIKWC